MGRLVTALGIILFALVVATGLHFVKVDQERQRLRHKLEEAAVAAAIYYDASAERRDAENQGRMIVASWPVLFWEDGLTVRSRVAADFDNMVALQRERAKAINTPTNPPARR